MSGLHVMIVCGGTGGHLSPGIAVGQRLLEDGCRVELVLSNKEIDSRLASNYPDFEYLRTPGASFSWKPHRMLNFLVQNFLGLFAGYITLLKRKPDAVLAFGGFVSIGYALSAKLLGFPLFLHEANRRAGRSIRMLSGLAEVVYLPGGVSLPKLSPGKSKVMGMPLRKEIVHIPKEEIRRRLGLQRSQKVLLVLGGSQGALALNLWVEQNLKVLLAEKISVLLVSGPGKMIAPLESSAEEDAVFRAIEFSDTIHEWISAADVVVGRAGAGTLAELVRCLTPSILVPYPHSADGHQLENALDMERRGCAVVIEQKRIEYLLREVVDLTYNDWMLGQMRRNLRLLNRGDAARLLADDLTRRVNARLKTIQEVAEA